MVDVATLFGLVLVAFAGGAIGASIGGLPAFSIAGVIVVVGEVVTVVTESLGGGTAETLGAVGITGSLGLGPGFGPHVAFAGGVAAAAYGARKGYVDTGFDFHEAKNVTRALGTEPDVLAVGGAFGVLGLLVARASTALSLPWHPVFFSVVVTAFVHRIALGYPLVGDVRGGLLDMSPFERGERRSPMRERYGDARTDGGGPSDADTSERTGDARFVVEPWLPHQYEWANVALLGAVVGAFGAFVTYRTGSTFLAFGLTAASLLFLALGMGKMPVTHHMALPAGIAVVGLAGGAVPGVVSGGVTAAELQGAMALWVAVIVGAAFGLVGGLAGELAQRVLYAHADTHLDPPAASIVVTSCLVAVLDVLGVFQQSVVPTLGL